MTDQQISLRLGISTRTVGRHVARLLADLGASTRFEAGVLLERRRQTAGQLSTIR
jgi:DNA-binding NarL/FixJ family response regulator